MNEYVREEEITRLLSAMVQSQSVNPPVDTTACAAILSGVLEAEGIETRLVEPQPGAVNVVGILRGRQPGRKLVLNGHIDTVPAGDGWTTDPFSGEIRDGFLYGRGSCDMKSGVAAMLMAMVGLKRSRLPFDGEIIFQAVADEETGSLLGTRYLLDHGYGSDADFAICTEPTSLRVELGNRGLRWLDVTVRGMASHAGRPQLGRNAISCASALIAAIDAIEFQQRNDAFEIPAPSISVTTISGGHTANVIPDHCTFSIDRRMLPGETGEDVRAGIEQAFEPVRARYPDVAIDITERDGFWNPYLIHEDEEIVRAVASAVERVTATRPVLGSKAACTDASHLVTLAGIPTVLFGPGNERLSHKPDERVAVADLVLATRILMVACQMLLAPAAQDTETQV
jgi:succinyl-diaminopimelate desuccinylase